MVTFGLLRDLAQKELSEYLDKYAGTKVTICCFFIWLVSKTKHTKDEQAIDWCKHFTPLASLYPFHVVAAKYLAVHFVA